MKNIVVIGEVIAEILADAPGDGFLETMALTGPYPSGAPAIYAAQVAAMDHPSAIISTVGDDDFGRMALNRLTRDGVDITGIGVSGDYPTGTAFVRYRSDGARDFIFNIRHAACGLEPDQALALPVLDRAGHLHVMGSSLSSPGLIACNLAAAHAIKARGGTVSFDPNLRKEMLASPGIGDAMETILGLTDLFLPSGEELTLLTRAKRAPEAVAELLGRGVSAIVHKLGAEGVRYHDREGSEFLPAFPVEEIDPTGAGDCFGATFTVLWFRGIPTRQALSIASAAGAIAVGRKGPMEGTARLAELKAFIKARQETAL